MQEGLLDLSDLSEGNLDDFQIQLEIGVALHRGDISHKSIIKIKSPTGNYYLGFALGSPTKRWGSLSIADLDRHDRLLLVAESLNAAKIVNKSLFYRDKISEY